MTAFNRVLSSVIVLLVLLNLGCSKDSGVFSDLMEGSLNYTGSYPSVSTVTFHDNGKEVAMSAYPGQYILFFKLATPETEANQFIVSKGGKVIAKIPSIGYYLFEEKVTNPDDLIKAVSSNIQVEAILPHGFLLPKGAMVLDHCNLEHGIAVKSTLQQCAGSIDKCVDITKIDTLTKIKYASGHDIIHAIIDESNLKKSGNNLINLSFNGGLSTDKAYDYNNLSAREQSIYNYNWLMSMKTLIMTIGALKDEYRKNLIVTVAAGNENAPIDGILNDLRKSTRNELILRENIVLVSTEKISGIHANYALQDPDVIVLNNSTAVDGTSLAAPCALGYLESVINQKGVSASEALSTMKTASWLNRQTREVKMGDLLSMVGSEKFGVGLSNLSGSIIEHGNASQGDCVIKFVFEFESLEIIWNGTSGIMRMPVTATASKLSGNCIASGVSHGYVSGPITGNDLKFEGIISGTMTHSKGSWPLNLKFVGNKNSSSAITGVLTWPDAASEGFNGSSNLTLLKK